MHTRIYSGCLTWSCNSIKVCESHNIDKQVKAAFVALEKDLVPLQPSRPRSKAKKWKSQAAFLNRFVDVSQSAHVGFMWDLCIVQPFAKRLARVIVS